MTTIFDFVVMLSSCVVILSSCDVNEYEERRFSPDDFYRHYRH